MYVYLLAMQNNIFPIDFPKAFGAVFAKVLFSVNAFSSKLYAVGKTLQFAYLPQAPEEFLESSEDGLLSIVVRQAIGFTTNKL